MKKYNEFLNEKLVRENILTSDQQLLVDAIKNNNLQIIKNIIAKGINVNELMFKIFEDDKYYRWTPLIYVSMRHQKLRNYGEKINGSESDDNLILKELIKAGANLDIKDRDGNTALHYIADYGGILLLKELIKAGANVNIQDGNGCIPLQNALYSRNKEMTIELINSGSDINLKNNNDESFKDSFDYISPMKGDYLYFKDDDRQEIINSCPSLKIYYDAEKYNL